MVQHDGPREPSNSDAEQHANLITILQQTVEQALVAAGASCGLAVVLEEGRMPALYAAGMSVPAALKTLLTSQDAMPPLLRQFLTGNESVLIARPAARNGGVDLAELLEASSLLLIPIARQAHSFSYLLLGRAASKPRFARLDLARGEVVAARAAGTLGGLQAQARAARLASYHDAITRIGLLLASAHSRETIKACIVDELGKLLDVTYCSFIVYSADYSIATIQALFRKPGYPDIQPRSYPIADFWITWPPPQNGFMVEDLKSMDLSHPALQYFDQIGVRAIISIPLSIKGQLYGELLLSDYAGPHYWSQDEQQVLQTIGAYASAALENALLVDEQARRTAALEELEQMAQRLLAVLEQDVIFEVVLETVARLLRPDFVSIFLYEADHKHLRLAAGQGWIADDIGAITIPLTDAFLSGYSFLHQEETVVENLSQDPRFVANSRLTEYGIVSGLSVPLIVSEHGLGVLAIYYRHQRTFETLDLQTLTLAAGQLATTIEKARLFTEMQRLGEFNQVLLQAQGAGVAMSNKEGRLAFVNKHLCEMLGYREAELLGGTWDMAIAPRERGRISAVIGDVNSSAQYETVLLARSGEEVPVLVSARVVRQRGEIIGALATLTDLRERKRSEAQLEQFRSVIETMIEGMLILLPRGTISYTNPAIDAILGVEPGSLIGSDIRDLNIEDAQLPSPLALLRLARSEGWSGEMRVRRPDGTLVHLATSLIAMRDPRNRVEAYAALVRDQTQVKILQQQLIQSERLNAIGSLVAGVAHEINNPLTSIYGYLDLALIEPDLSPDVRTDLIAARSEAGRAARIVRNLLTFARQQSTQRQEVDLNELLQQTIELRTYHFRSDQISLVLDLDERLPHIIADGPQLQQVFFNLITNSHQALRGWDGPRELRITTRLQPGSAQVVISDTGPGILPDALPHIFEPFFTTKPVGEGTGLGLSIAHGIIEEHSGSIWAESEPGQGVFFAVELPLAVEPPTPPLSGPDEEPHAWLYQGTALVIDDEPGVLDVLTRMLQHCGLQVQGLSEAQQALSLLERGFSYDLIFCDVRLQGMSGIEFFNIVQIRHPELVKRIIFVSGDTMNEEMIAFVNATGRPTQQKPFNLTDLTNLVGQLLSPSSPH